MERFTRVTGCAAPMVRDDIGTTDILPAIEMANIAAEGHAALLFARWRYLRDRVPNPDFLLNKPAWQKATILLAGRNLGCGSSYDAAPKALRAYGFRVLIAPSFAGIFHSNCFRVGLLPVVLDEADVRRLAAEAEGKPGHPTVTIDLEALTVTGLEVCPLPFQVPSILRDMMMAGMDEIEWIKAHDGLERFIAEDRNRRPWAHRA